MMSWKVCRRVVQLKKQKHKTMTSFLAHCRLLQPQKKKPQDNDEPPGSSLSYATQEKNKKTQNTMNQEARRHIL